MKKKCKWIIFILLLCTFAFVWEVYALYSSRSYQKAVLSTIREEVPFSSNYLKLVSYSSSEPEYTVISPAITLKGDEQEISFTVTVNNFPITKTSQTANKPISYQAEFTVEGSAECSVKPDYNLFSTKVGTETKTFTHTLKKGSNTDRYEITMPAAELGKAKIKICVRPQSDSLATVSNMMLVGELVPKETAKDVAFECRGEFTDAESNVESFSKPYDYDAFKYHIYITKGQADVVLKWDDSLVILDPGFTELVKGTEVKGKLEFHMDYDEMDAYDVIFYRRKGKNENAEWQNSWKNLGNYISVTGTEIK